MGAMSRVVGLCLLTAAVLTAQEKPTVDLALLRDAATKKETEWSALAQGLESKIARMLPCDVKVRGAISEVSRASEARLTSLAQYLRSASQKATDNSVQTRLLISGQDAFTVVLNTERAEVAGELAAVQGQLLDLGESAKQRIQLEQAQKVLAGIAAMTRQREMRAAELAAWGAELAASLHELDENYQKEQAAFEKELNALTAETARWTEYYAARLDRAQTECVITNDTGTPDAPASRGKRR